MDWEKAFDKVTHEGLIEAIRRIGVDQKFVNIIKDMYSKATFKIQQEDSETGWIKQGAGRRQGCPLSPYLFLIVMSVIFHDINQDRQLKEKLGKSRVHGTVWDEVVFADVTILFSESNEGLQALLHEIEKESKKYGMNLNKNKFEIICINNNNIEHKDKVRFKDGKW